MSNDSEATAEAEAEAEEVAQEESAEAEVAEEEATEEQATEDEAAEDETAEDEDGDDESSLEAGDFVQIDYTARTVEDGQLVDTTDQETAEEEGVDEEGREFGPRTIVLGEGHIFESVEESIIGSEVGASGSAVVPSDEAFGEYNDEEVRTISKDKIPEDDQYPGARVQIDNKNGFVETIIGGRARVDFNHPLAGDDLEYEWEVIDVIEDRNEQAAGLLEMMLDVELNVWFDTDTVEEERLVEEDEDEEADEETEEAAAETDDEGTEDEEEVAEDEADEGPEYETVEVEKESLYIEAEPFLTMNQQWMMQKQQICQDLIDLIGVDRVVIQEIIDDAGMAGMMGAGLGGMGGDLEAALEEADIDAEDLADELG